MRSSRVAPSTASRLYSTSSTMDGVDLKAALRLQIEALAKRNELHAKHRSAGPRTREMGNRIVILREMLSKNPQEAFQYYLECVSYADETERIIGKKHAHFNDKMLPKLSTISVQEGEAVTTGDEQRNSNLSNYQSPVEESSWQDADKFYYNRKWWRIFCLNGAKEGQQRQAEENVRDLWTSQIEFFLSCLGFIVGVGSTLRFPAKVYQHGGGVFFIPYFVCLFFFGLPIVFMHLAIGQYSGLSASGAFWKLMPISSGIGWALVLLAVPVAIYYNIIVAWAVYYFWFSLNGFLTDKLPWDSCRPEWEARFNCCDLRDFACLNSTETILAPEAYFHFNVLGRDDSDLSLGPIQDHLFAALAVAWILVFFGVFKGIGSIGWTAAVTATVPYLLLVILLLRGTSLPGADDGLRYLFIPKMDKLWSLGMWKTAAEQVFYELGIDAGPLISMASFSRFRNNIYRDAVLLVLVDALTSVLSGMVIFSFIGFLAHNSGLEIKSVLQHDPSYLAFSVYPGVTSFMAIGPLWAALFFAMFALSAVDAEFAWLEMIASSIMYQLGEKSKWVEDRILALLCIVGFIGGIPLTCKGGIYIFHAIESLNANWNSFTLALLQIVLVCFFYGVNNFMEDIRVMLRRPQLPTRMNEWSIGRRIVHFFGPTGGYIKWCWCLFCPIILTGLLLASAFSYQRVSLGKTVLPMAYELVAWVCMTGPLLIIPITAAYTLYDAKRRSRPLKTVFSTEEWRKGHPAESVEKEKQKREREASEAASHYMYIEDPASRNASTRSRVLFHENDYGRLAGRISDWQNRENTGGSTGERSTASTDHEHGPLEMSLFGSPPAMQGLSESLLRRQRQLTEEEETSFVEDSPTPSAPQSRSIGTSSYEKRRTAFSRRVHSDAFDSAVPNRAKSPSKVNSKSSGVSSVSAPPAPTIGSLLSIVSAKKQLGEDNRTRSKSIGSADAKDLEIVEKEEARRESSSRHSSSSSSYSGRIKTERKTVIRRGGFESTESLGPQSSISITPCDEAIHHSLSSLAISHEAFQRSSKPTGPTTKLSMLKRPAPVGVPWPMVPSSLSSPPPPLPSASAPTSRIPSPLPPTNPFAREDQATLRKAKGL